MMKEEVKSEETAIDTGDAIETAVPANWQRKVALFLTGQTISLFGSMLVQYALVWYITLSTKSGVLLMVSTLCGFLPQILVSIPAGVWADRVNRKKLIIFADIMIAVSTLALALLWLSGLGSLWMLFVVSAIRSVGAGIQTPAVSALIPQLVPQAKLMRVNGINGSIQSVTMLLAPMLSGAMLSMISLESVFFVDVATAIVGVTILALMHIPLHSKALEENKPAYWHDMKIGLRYIWDHAFLKNLVFFYFIFMFLIVPGALLTPLMVARVYGDEVWRLTAIEVAFSIGVTGGGILIASWGGFKNRITTITLSCFIFGVLSFILGFTNQFWQFMLIMVLMGISMPMFNTPNTTLLQERVEGDMLGRVFSLVQVGSSAAMPVGMMFFGPLADVVRVEYMLIVTGFLCIIMTVFMRMDKKLRYAESA